MSCAVASHSVSARRVQIEQDLATVATTPVRLHPNLAQVYRRQKIKFPSVPHQASATVIPSSRKTPLTRNFFHNSNIGKTLPDKVQFSHSPFAGEGILLDYFGLKLIKGCAAWRHACLVRFGTGTNAKRATLDEAIARSVKLVAGRGFEPLTFRL
jgi:hypothetical protein